MFFPLGTSHRVDWSSCKSMWARIFTHQLPIIIFIWPWNYQILWVNFLVYNFQSHFFFWYLIQAKNSNFANLNVLFKLKWLSPLVQSIVEFCWLWRTCVRRHLAPVCWRRCTGQCISFCSEVRRIGENCWKQLENSADLLLSVWFHVSTNSRKVFATPWRMVGSINTIKSLILKLNIKINKNVYKYFENFTSNAKNPNITKI